MLAPDLHSHSTFSLLDGMGTPLDVVNRAKELGWKSACLSEHGWLGSAPTFYKACRENGINPILAVELYVVPNDFLGARGKEFRWKQNHLTVLALSKEGYHNLVAWTTLSSSRENFYDRPRISLDAMAEIAPYPLHHNVVLSGCLASELAVTMAESNGDLSAGEAWVASTKQLFQNLYIEIQAHGYRKFYDRGLVEYESMVEREAQVREKLIRLAKQTNTPLILTNDSHFQSPSQREAHLILIAQKRNHGNRVQVSDYLPEYGYMMNYLQPLEKIAERHGLPQECIDSALQISQEASVRLDPLDNFSYCVAPYTRILCEDLRWVKASELIIGDRLWGFDESADKGERRRWRISTVNRVTRRKLRCWRLTFSDGNEVISSEGHRWLTWSRSNRGAEWRYTGDVLEGDIFPRYFDVWETENTYDAGWLASAFECEGSLSFNGASAGGHHLEFTQNENSVLSRTQTLLHERGFRLSERKHSQGATTLRVQGGVSESLRFLGSTRADRLIKKLSRLEGAQFCKKSVVYVVKREYVGVREVVALETSEKTFIAEGFGSHNSIPFSGYDDPQEKIRKRSKGRLAALVKKHGKEARERFEFELSAMKDFAHYLLLMSDFIIAAHRQGILTNTRGSAANSLVCYCLRIHNIDPMPEAYNLLFSRFVNPARKKLPDIDIDIEKDRYDDFMRIVIEKMEALEGEGQVAQICNYGTFANRAAFRLIADALGMSKGDQDEISKLLPQMIDSGMVDEEVDVYSALKHEYPEIYDLVSGVFDSIRNLSQHACGWLFGTRDRPIDKWVPLALIASSGSSVTAYDLKSLDDMGLVKGDFLRLRTLSVIQRCRRMLAQDTLSIEDIPLDDPETFEMLRLGKTEGVFTLQGKENRKGVVEMEVTDEHDVIKSVAIYRPALTREKKNAIYNKRRKGLEPVDYAHPILEEILGPTYGIPVFQEQVMEICYAVGMSDAEVDDIYKAIKMAKGVGRGAKEAFSKVKPAFLAACKRNKIRNADEIWKEVEASQGYGFNKGHATSYGRLGIRAAYLKCHHAPEFVTALLDVYPEKSKYIASARADGFRFLPPSVNKSSAGFSLDGDQIRVGLSRIKGLGPAAVNEIINGQPFSTFDDFKERTTRRSLNVSRIETLAELGAFDDLGIRGIGDDAVEYAALGFTLRRPQALRGVKPRYVGERYSDSGWHHRGRYRGAELTEGKASVSKLFWIPPLEDSRGFKLLDLKASSWAMSKSYLLTAVDENGIGFHLMAPEDKHTAEILKYLVRLKGCVVSADGRVRQPFLQDGPLGFSFYGISGAAYKHDPQVFGEMVEAKHLKKLVKLHLARRNSGT
jgi:DNA polymerase III alpha subunit